MASPIYVGALLPDSSGRSRFRIDEHRTKGGFAEIWLAWDLVDERDVVVRAYFFREGDTVARVQATLEQKPRFLAGCRTQAGLPHDLVAPVIDLVERGWSDPRAPTGYDDVLPFCVVEYFPLGNLYDLLLTVAPARRRRLALLVLERSLGLLQRLHEQHAMAHEDAKLLNLLVRQDSDTLAVRLTDFDTARSAQRLTDTGRGGRPPGWLPADRAAYHRGGGTHDMAARQCWDVQTMAASVRRVMAATEAQPWPGNAPGEHQRALGHELGPLLDELQQGRHPTATSALAAIATLRAQATQPWDRIWPVAELLGGRLRRPGTAEQGTILPAAAAADPAMPPAPGTILPGHLERPATTLPPTPPAAPVHTSPATTPPPLRMSPTTLLPGAALPSAAPTPVVVRPATPVTSGPVESAPEAPRTDRPRHRQRGSVWAVVALSTVGILVLATGAVSTAAMVVDQRTDQADAMAHEVLQRFDGNNPAGVSIEKQTASDLAANTELAADLAQLRALAHEARELWPRTQRAWVALGEVERQYCALELEGRDCGLALAALLEASQGKDSELAARATRSLVYVHEHLGHASCDDARLADLGDWAAALDQWEALAPDGEAAWVARARARQAVAAGDRSSALEWLTLSTDRARELPGTAADRRTLIKRNARSAGALLCHAGTPRLEDWLQGEPAVREVWQACGKLAIGELDGVDQALTRALHRMPAEAPPSEDGCAVPDDANARLRALRTEVRAAMAAGPDAPLPSCTELEIFPLEAR